MQTENVIDLQEVNRVSVKCRNCGAVTSVELEAENQIVTNGCGNCKSSNEFGVGLNSFSSLVMELRQLRATAAKYPCEFRLRIAEAN
jgi:transcription elongation factor Elf1